jgi:hypothetical protein
MDILYDMLGVAHWMSALSVGEFDYAAVAAIGEYKSLHGCNHPILTAIFQSAALRLQLYSHAITHLFSRLSLK